MKDQMKNLIESEKSSDDITSELSEQTDFPPRLSSDIRDFLKAAEEVRVGAKNDPDFDNIMSQHLGSDWKRKFSDLISELDSMV